MKLQFRILWIDDDWSDDETKIRLEQEKNTILQHLEADYFEGTIDLDTWTLDTTQPFPYDSEHYDLFIVDFNIWDKNGLEYIKRIRESGKYADIIFYSKNWIQQEILKYLNDWNDFLEWVFIAKREELAMKFQDLLDIIDKKVNNLYSMRGLVLAETADLDYILCEIINKLYEQHSLSKNISLPIKSQWIWNFEIINQDNMFLESWWTTFTDWLNKKWTNEIFCEFFINPSSPLFWFAEINSTFKGKVIKYRRFYTQKRNPLAHWKTENDGNGNLSANGLSYSILELKKCRKNLLDFKEKFEEFLDNIKE